MDYYLKIIKPLSNLDNTKKYEACISTCLFKMQNEYRDFSKYVNPIFEWIKYIPKSSYVRLYVDASVLEDKNFLRLLDFNLNNLEIILYEFKDFLIESNKKEYYHDGTFGSIIRFLSLYNKPELPKTVKYVWIADVDMLPNYFNIDYIEELKKNNSDVLYSSMACYLREWVLNDVHYPIIANKFITNIQSQNIQYDIKDFEKYLSDVLKGKYDEIKNSILKRKSKSNIKYFPYGFDELFANIYLYKTIQPYKKIIYYNISLKPFKNYVSNVNIKTILDTSYSLESKLYYNDSLNDSSFKKISNKIIKLQRQAYYQILKQKHSIISYRLNLTLEDFEKYNKNITPIQDSIMNTILYI